MVDIAFFGGSFNPPHRGHEAVVRFLATIPFFDEVWIVPVFSHAFSKELVSYDLRLNMCELAFGDMSPKVKISSIEEECGLKPSYTLSVIRFAKSKCPQNKFWLVLGSDCQKKLPHWYEYQKLKNEVNFFFLPRPGCHESPFPSVSSSQIRESLQSDLPCESLLNPKVISKIREHHLYGSS